jgi:glycosyltransferase involved in cell wall biosynthesis
MISVLMPVKGECPYLAIAIESIIVQTFQEWELIICKDLVDIASEKYISDLVSSDSRIRMVETLGLPLPSALNKGLETCRGEYIARFDADDIMLPERLQIQHHFLEKNPEYVVCGGQIVIINEKQKLSFISPYFNLKNRTLKNKMNYKCPFPHPATIIRTNALREVFGYSPRYKFAEDYELWLRLSRLGKFANLKKPILAYRVYASQTSARYLGETRLYMASALVERLSDGQEDIKSHEIPISAEVFQKQYFSLVQFKREIVNTYYRSDPFLADLLRQPMVGSKRKSLLKGIFEVISTIIRRFTHTILRLAVSAYSLLVIRPVWKGYVTRLSAESATNK